MSRRLTCEEIFPKRGLIVHTYSFECPFCGHTVERGSRAEGFRKAGMSHHVYACWEIGLYLRGYFIGAYRRTKPYGSFVLKIEDAASVDWGRRLIRSIKANIRKRIKEGVLHKLEPR